MSEPVKFEDEYPMAAAFLARRYAQGAPLRMYVPAKHPDAPMVKNWQGWSMTITAINGVPCNLRVR